LKNHAVLPDEEEGNAEDSNTNTMSDILAAYQSLLAPDFGGADSRVAIACEIMTLDDLKRDRKRHSVYTVQVLYDDEESKCTTSIAAEEQQQQQVVVNYDDGATLSSSTTMVTSSSETVYQIVVHPDDSVMDFKQALQRAYGAQWGLDQKRRDRHGLAMSWEVVVVSSDESTTADTADHGVRSSAEDSDDDAKQDELLILGNHWFLYTYHVEHGDLVHAIVRNDDED
jgi:hypothetical protein